METSVTSQPPEAGALPLEPETPLPLRPQGDALRDALRRVMIAWLFGAAWMYITTGAVLTQYSKLLGLPKFGFGLLAALPFAGALIQLPVSYFIERFGHHKSIFIASGLIHRGLWLLIAVIPWVFPQRWWCPAFLLFIFVSALSGHATTPVWISWMAGLVPSALRGRYFSRRTQVGQAVGLVITVLTGVVLDRSGLIGQGALIKTISAALAVAAVCGMIDFLFFAKVPPPPGPRPNRTVSVMGMIRQPLSDPNFRRFVGFTASLTFSVGYIGQFVWLFMFDVAGFSNTVANTMLVVMPLIVTMIAYPVWGRLIDRVGRKPLLVICGLIVVPGALPWIFLDRQSLWPVYLFVVIITAAWPAVDLANFNILLGMTDSLKGRRYGTAYVAINSVVVAIAGVLSGLFGGAIAEALGDWKGSLLGHPLTYHGVLFIISAVLRAASLLWLIRLEDTGAHSTRAALRFMGATLYSNLQQAVFMPGRVVVSIGRWTYKLNPRRSAR